MPRRSCTFSDVLTGLTKIAWVTTWIIFFSQLICLIHMTKLWLSDTWPHPLTDDELILWANPSYRNVCFLSLTTRSHARSFWISCVGRPTFNPELISMGLFERVHTLGYSEYWTPDFSGLVVVGAFDWTIASASGVAFVLCKHWPTSSCFLLQCTVCRVTLRCLSTKRCLFTMHAYPGASPSRELLS